MSGIATGNLRLLNVAKALRESPSPTKFCMGNYAQDCRTPACALGHYILRTDLQSAFKLAVWSGADSWLRPTLADGTPVLLNGREMREHFAITGSEAEELFDEEGCGEATTAIEAAEYIESFVADREAQS